MDLRGLDIYRVLVILCGGVVWYCGVGGLGGSKNGQKWVKFYGMELPWVGAFTEKWGSGYRNPVQNLGEKWENHEKSGN